MNDLLVRDVRVVDGTGAPWFSGSVAVDAGEITRVFRERTPDIAAERVVEADGDVERLSARLPPADAVRSAADRTVP